MELEIISKECIKPSSPTPHHLRNHKFSLLDQHTPHDHIPLILFYSLNQEENHSPSDINHIISRPELMSKFLPDNGKWSANPGNHVAGVQVTTFAFCGIAVGIYVSHMIADGTAFSWFLKSWAATARKDTDEEIHPKFDAPTFFPYKDEYPSEELLTAMLTLQKKFGRYITKRFVFYASAIAKLKAAAASSGVENPTRVEVVTALFTKRFMAALKLKCSSEKPFLLTHTVNLRQKAMPQFSEYMGNFVLNASILRKDVDADLHALVREMKEGIAKVNGYFVNSPQGDEGLLNLIEQIKYEREIYAAAVDKISFTSWCNFGFYDLDFGWGIPAWASLIGLNDSATFHNMIVFMDTRQGNGIEAWAFLLEEDMVKLEVDEELLAFSTVDRNPLI